MSRRIDIELTSSLGDGNWTWRAAGAKQPKGTLSSDILGDGAAVGDVIKVEVDQEIDGITVRSVVGEREKQDRSDLLELLPSEREFQPVIETRAKRGKGDKRGREGRDGRDGRPRRDRKSRGDRNDRGDRGDRGDRKGGGDRDDRGRDGRGGDGRDRSRGRGRGRPSFTPPPEVPKRPKPKRLRPGKANRSAVLADLPEEQRPIAELALQGMGAVRQRLEEENAKAVAEGRAIMPEASVLKLAEDLIPRLRVAEWKDRAEAAQRQMEHLDLRDLRSVVAAAGDPVVARDDSTTALAAELTEALSTKQEQELALWFGDVDAALAVGRVIRALRLSSQPPKAGVPFPTDIAQRLLESTNASLAPMDSPERWAATLEAAAFSPIHNSVQPARKPDTVNDELLSTVKRLAPALPLVAELFELEVDPKAPMPKPLRPGPRTRKGQDGDRSRGRQNDDRSTRSDRSKQPRGDKRGRGDGPRPKRKGGAAASQASDAVPSASDDAADAGDTSATTGAGPDATQTAPIETASTNSTVAPEPDAATTPEPAAPTQADDSTTPTPDAANTREPAASTQADDFTTPTPDTPTTPDAPDAPDAPDTPEPADTPDAADTPEPAAPTQAEHTAEPEPTAPEPAPSDTSDAVPASDADESASDNEST